MNDPASLRKKIAELESENRRLRESGGSTDQSKAGFTTMKPTSQSAFSQDKEWMNFGGNATMERPVTASNQNQKIREL